jgi:hypothetical protein
MTKRKRPWARRLTWLALATGFALLARESPAADGGRTNTRDSWDDACQGKKPGDSCVVDNVDEVLSGKCVAMPEGDLHCLLDPPSALTRPCDGKPVGAACAAPFDSGMVDGACSRGRNGRLQCVPGASPTAPPPPAMFRACDRKKERASCSAPVDKRNLPGHCTKVSAGLFCRPGPWRRGE